MSSPPISPLAVDWCIERRDWRLVPRLCSAGVLIAHPGVAMALTDRVADHLPAFDPVEGIAPLLLVGLSCFRPFDRLPDAPDVALAERFVELVRAGETIPTDALYTLPYFQTDLPVDDLDEMMTRFAHDLRRRAGRPPLVGGVHGDDVGDAARQRVARGDARRAVGADRFDRQLARDPSPRRTTGAPARAARGAGRGRVTAACDRAGRSVDVG